MVSINSYFLILNYDALFSSIRVIIKRIAFLLQIRIFFSCFQNWLKKYEYLVKFTLLLSIRCDLIILSVIVLTRCNNWIKAIFSIAISPYLWMARMSVKYNPRTWIWYFFFFWKEYKRIHLRTKCVTCKSSSKLLVFY